MPNERYRKIDGLRVFAAMGIVLMHVQANTDFLCSGFVVEKLIPSFTNLVFLFMMISGFSMCCGYFEKYVTGTINLEQFYKKRFAKVWPYFACLCFLELLASPSMDTLCQVLANLTLCFGLIPNHNIEVIGVGWFLGVVFVFYFIFPFFCFLLSDKRRAWMAFAASAVLNLLCKNYFCVGRTSMAYCAVFFMAGGMMYLYRKPLEKMANIFGFAVLMGIAAATVAYFVAGPSVIKILVLYGLVLLYGLGTPQGRFSILANSVTGFLSNISMEIYLSHMIIFRVLEKILPWKTVLSWGAGGYAFVVIGTLAGTVVLAVALQHVLAVLRKFTKRTI